MNLFNNYSLLKLLFHTRAVYDVGLGSNSPESLSTLLTPSSSLTMGSGEGVMDL
jgi:hypothetical protein